MGTDARIAVVDSTAGALRSSAELILSKCAVTSGCSLTGDGQLTIGGRTSKVWYGYPLNRSRGGEYWGIDEAMQISGSVTYSAPADYYAYFKVSGARDPDTCVATYKHNDTTGPTITTTTTGC